MKWNLLWIFWGICQRLVIHEVWKFFFVNGFKLEFLVQNSSQFWSQNQEKSDKMFHKESRLKNYSRVNHLYKYGFIIRYLNMSLFKANKKLLIGKPNKVRRNHETCWVLFPNKAFISFIYFSMDWVSVATAITEVKKNYSHMKWVNKRKWISHKRVIQQFVDLTNETTWKSTKFTLNIKSYFSIFISGNSKEN